MAEKYLSIPDIAAILGTTDRFPRRLIEERRIEFKRFGRHVRIAESVLRAYIDSLSTNTGQAMNAPRLGSPYLTADEAAGYIRFPKKRIYNLTRAGSIPHRKQDGRLLFRRDELDAWLDDPERFRDGYAHALSRAGIESAESLGAMFGIDVTSEAFWTSSLDVCRARISEYEALAAAL